MVYIVRRRFGTEVGIGELRPGIKPENRQPGSRHPNPPMPAHSSEADGSRDAYGSTAMNTPICFRSKGGACATGLAPAKLG